MPDLDRSEDKDAKKVGKVISIGSSSSKSKKSVSKKSVSLLLIVIALIILVVSVAYYLFQNKNKEAGSFILQAPVSEGICDDDLVNRVHVLFDLDKVSELEKVVSEIKLRDNNESDPNCIVPAFIYAINTGNVGEAERLMAQFSQLSNAQDKLNGIYKILMNNVASPIYILTAYCSGSIIPELKCVLSRRQIKSMS